MNNEIFEDELEVTEYMESLYSVEEEFEVVEDFQQLVDEEL